MISPIRILDLKYFRLYWRHDTPNDPIEIWSEIGPDDYEMRKVECYADGRRDPASGDMNSELLAVFPFSEGDRPLGEDLELVEISKTDFERIWSSSTST